jgi:TolB-like protein/class 3 adenylate cyclase/Tfp pilus assembly protein PilF
LSRVAYESYSPGNMADVSDSATQMRIGHVLFMDVVGYSALLLDEQRELQQQLTQIVRETEQVRAAEAKGRLIRLPTGDGMALVFFGSPEAPIRCAVEIGRALKSHPEIRLRMGIHSGPVDEVKDVNDQVNVAGAGINVAQRVMDCADAGHILLSKRVADDLAQSRQWRPYLHELGECAVKHGVPLFVVNLYTDEVGNAELPRRFKEAKLAQRPPPGYRRKAVLATAGALIAAGLLSGAWFLFRQPLPPEKSIAVLPFANFSDDKENAFFADGIQDDILTSLAEIKDLKVISRSSVMRFRNIAAQNLRAISKLLDVANVLEGSVRREGDRVVVNVQLIDALNDRNIWANHYDRTLVDSLGLQGELATEIAEALRVRLSPEEKARIGTKPTENADAYVFYLRANQIARNPDTLLEDYNVAIDLYTKAIALDPNFALAHARLASTAAAIFHFYEPLDKWKKMARGEADTALHLQPNLAEAHFALGECIYWFDRDYSLALKQFDLALRFSPNDAEISRLIAAIKRRQGKWQEALHAYQAVQKIDPQNPNAVRELLFTNTAMRRWAQGAHWAQRWRTMAPASLVAVIQSGYVNFWWKGDTGSLKSFLDKVPQGVDPDGEVTASKWDLAMIERNFAGAKHALEASPLQEFSYMNGDATPKSFLEGCIYLAQGSAPEAQKNFDAARSIWEKAIKEAPASADRHANLGLLYAFMGRNDDAIREGRLAVALKPESKDAVDGAIMNCYLALIYARVGKNDLAIPLIERLLKTPGTVDSVDYSITRNDLKRRWEWDPLRSDPRFQKLIAQASP